MEKVLMALSGGVDSGVSAALLLERGFELAGLFMRHRYQRSLAPEQMDEFLARLDANSRLRVWRVDGVGVESLKEVDWRREGWPFAIPADAVSAFDLANSLGVELNLLDLDSPFTEIVDDFVERYYAAQTPNPCVLCNRKIKFGLLADVATQWRADYLATGHYVQKRRVAEWIDDLRINAPEVAATLPEWLAESPSDYCITRSPSPKDQSYFLYGIAQAALNRTLFPVGAFEKSGVRKMAQERALCVATRKDSQEVCFIPDDGRVDFIRKIVDEEPERWKSVPRESDGPFLSLEGKVIGRHGGYERYTIGQRKGLGMGFGERIFVQSVDSSTRAVVLGPYDALARSEINAVDSNWHARVPVGEDFRCEIKIRYRNESTAATVRVEEDGSFKVSTDAPCYGVAPGQSVVCYWRDRLLGGGRITL